MHGNRPVRGFTLIELLVVIAIIGVLSSVVLASLNTARERARDSKRVQDIQQVMRAIELYALDNNGAYPPQAVGADGCNHVTCMSGLAPVLVPTYISAMPSDPDPTWAHTTADYRYYRCSGGLQYSVIMHHETGTDQNGWCNVHTTSGPYIGPATCFMNAGGVPTYGWCDDEM